MIDVEQSSNINKKDKNIKEIVFKYTNTNSNIVLSTTHFNILDMLLTYLRKQKFEAFLNIAEDNIEVYKNQTNQLFTSITVHKLRCMEA